MRVDVWSDVVCPWCYIGKRRLEAALAKFPQRDQVQVVFRAFELDPQAPRDSSQTMVQRLAEKYGGGEENAKAMMERVSAIAAQDGLSYRLDLTRPENTFDAHRLLAFAASQGKQLALAEALFKAYFTEGKRLSQHEVLAQIAVSAGLDRAATEKVLGDPNTYAPEVRDDEKKAAALGIRGVPCAVAAGKYGIAGAQPVEAFTEMLETAWKQAQN